MAQRKIIMPIHRPGGPRFGAKLSDADNTRGERTGREKRTVPSGGPPKRKVALNEVLAHPMPNYRRGDIGGLYTYNPPIGEADFLSFRRCFATTAPIDELGVSMAGLDIIVFGRRDGDTATRDSVFGGVMPEMSERAKFAQRLVDAWNQPEQLLRFSPWSMPLGILFWQLRFSFERNLGFVCDFDEGLRWPAHAGGLLHLSPDHTKVVKEKDRTARHRDGGGDEEAYSADNWLWMKPGAEPSPIGSMDMAHRFREYVGDYRDAVINAAIRAKQYGLPFHMARYWAEHLMGSEIAAVGEQAAEDAAAMQAGDAFAIGKHTIFEFLEPGSAQGTFLNEREKIIEAKVQRDVNHTATLAVPGVGGPTQSSNQGRVTKNEAVTAWAAYCSHVLDKALRRNLEVQEAMFPGSVPMLEGDETEPFIMLVPRGIRAAAASVTRNPSPTGPGAQNAQGNNDDKQAAPDDEPKPSKPNVGS